jgi:hypothetical protein
MTTAGQVSVFNCFSEQMTMFSVNDGDLGTIEAWNTAPGAMLYAPAGRAVPRSLNPASGQFYGGTNLVTIDWMGEIFHIEVAIDQNQHPLNESLALFILRSGYWLLNAFGVPISSGPLVVGPVEPAPLDPGKKTPA